MRTKACWERSPFDAGQTLTTDLVRARKKSRHMALMGLVKLVRPFADLYPLSIMERAQMDPVIAQEVAHGDWD